MAREVVAGVPLEGLEPVLEAAADEVESGADTVGTVLARLDCLTGALEAPDRRWGDVVLELRGSGRPEVLGVGLGLERVEVLVALGVGRGDGDGGRGATLLMDDGCDVRVDAVGVTDMLVIEAGGCTEIEELEVAGLEGALVVEVAGLEGALAVEVTVSEGLVVLEVAVSEALDVLESVPMADEVVVPPEGPMLLKVLATEPAADAEGPVPIAAYSTMPTMAAMHSPSAVDHNVEPLVTGPGTRHTLSWTVVGLAQHTHLGQTERSCSPQEWRKSRSGPGQSACRKHVTAGAMPSTWTCGARPDVPRWPHVRGPRHAGLLPRRWHRNLGGDARQHDPAAVPDSALHPAEGAVHHHGRPRRGGAGAIWTTPRPITVIPLVFSTVADEELRAVLMRTECAFVDLFGCPARSGGAGACTSMPPGSSGQRARRGGSAPVRRSA